jgi:hypothetical protein
MFQYMLVVFSILTFCGVLTKSYPQTIAGFKFLTEERKKLPSIRRYASFVSYTFILLGILHIPIYFIANHFNFVDSYIFISVALIVGGSFFLVIKGQYVDFK